MKTVKLSKLQRAYFTDLATQKNRIERDLQIAAGVALAGAGIDLTPDMQFGFDGTSLQFSLPEVKE
jgi:hypothetical protein